ncbi:MAG: molybdopterin-synthase adenylyltransferase MoeB [Opitutaceae bacterium]|nr:molybdopterin-synthase adenylyltransferase MoeB [Opitutaceae bacterium]
MKTNPQPSHLSSSETARYSRHILLQEIGVSGQEKLKASKVLIIGVGGLGGPVALYLTASGIGTLGLVDFDQVELHNLQRQILFGTKDVGIEKTAIANERLNEINPHTQIHTYPYKVTADNALDLFSAYDLIIDCTDNFPTRYLITDAAYLTGKPIIHGSLFKFEGQVSLFHPHQKGPCYRCLFPNPPAPGSVPNCGEAGVMGALCGIIGSFQAMEAIKFIAGFGESLLERLLLVDALSMQFQTIKSKKNPHCPLCGFDSKITHLNPKDYSQHCEIDMQDQTENNDYPLEIDPSEATHLIENDSNVILLDVREPMELQICCIEKSICIPMGQIEKRLNELPKDKHILAICHHGMRSMNVTQFLRSQGFSSVTSIRGGIDAWARQIDPSLQTY